MLTWKMDQQIDVVVVAVVVVEMMITLLYYHRQEMFHNHDHQAQNHLLVKLPMDSLYVIQYNHLLLDIYRQHYHHIHHV